MHSLLWFMLCCFVLEILNKTYFICEMLEWPAIKQTLQAPRFTLYLNFANNFKPAAPTPWAILLAQVHLQECRPTPAAHTGPQQKRLHCPISLQIFTAASPSNLGLVLLQISSFISEKALLRIPLPWVLHTCFRSFFMMFCHCKRSLNFFKGLPDISIKRFDGYSSWSLLKT